MIDFSFLSNENQAPLRFEVTRTFFRCLFIRAENVLWDEEAYVCMRGAGVNSRDFLYKAFVVFQSADMEQGRLKLQSPLERTMSLR